MSSKQRSRDRFAMTLIELLVASVLTSVLAGAVLLTLRVTYADAARLTRQTTASPQLLIEQIERDFANSRGARIAADRLTLTGFVATYDRQPTLRRARVQYRVAAVAGRPVLLREERLPDGATLRDVAWDNVGRFQVVSLTALDPDERPERDPDAAGLPPTPDAVAVTLTDARGQVVFRETVSRIGVGR